MKINEILTELGNTNHLYIQTVDYSNEQNFEISALGLNVVFFYGDRVITIVFAVNGKTELTGQGNAISILSSVLSIIRKELPNVLRKWNNTLRINFTADQTEPSRIKLYTKSIPLISEILGPDWIANRPVYSRGADLDVKFSWNKKLD